MDKFLEQKIRQLAMRVADDFDYELVDLNLFGRGRSMLLRLSIDKEGGVTLNDCETFSRRLSAVMDVEDPISGTYTLEVSSPGLDRPLKNAGDFERNIGKLVRLVTKEKIDNQSFFIGRLLAVRDDSVSLSISDGGKEIVLPFDKISKAKLEIEIK